MTQNMQWQLPSLGCSLLLLTVCCSRYYCCPFLDGLIVHSTIVSNSIMLRQKHRNISMNQIFPWCCIFVATTFRLSCNTSLLMPTTSQSIYVKRALVVLHFFFYYRQESCRTIFHSIAVLLDETFFIVTTTMFFVRKWYLYKLFWWIRNVLFVNNSYLRRTALDCRMTPLLFHYHQQHNTGTSDPQIPISIDFYAIENLNSHHLKLKSE